MMTFITAAFRFGYSRRGCSIVSIQDKMFCVVHCPISVASFLPPSTTIRHYQRTALATTAEEIGSIYCAILSFAHSRREENIAEINTRLVSVRSKLRRSVALNTNVIYEACPPFPYFLVLYSMIDNCIVFLERPLAYRAIQKYFRSAIVSNFILSATRTTTSCNITDNSPMAFPICFPWLNTSNLRGLAHS